MYQTLSFYKYVRLEDPVAFQGKLRCTFDQLGVVGRVYVASEGINAQISVPKETFSQFDQFMRSTTELAGVPYKLAVEELPDGPAFKKLIIKVKQKIVADGLDDASFDVTKTGEYLTAREFNDYVDDPEAVIVDMRNAYESEVGHFESAVTPEVDTFREELKVVPELLKDQRDKKIALYCTGGIRCEKASAWLRHNGFTDVKHLKGGIIDYKRQVEEEKLDNRFRGKNFVFDARLGERINNEIISTCHLCSSNKSDTHYHCKSEVCHVLYIGCDECVAKRDGYCSLWCVLFDRLPEGLKKTYARIQNRFFRPAQFKKHRLRPKLS